MPRSSTEETRSPLLCPSGRLDVRQHEINQWDHGSCANPPMSISTWPGRLQRGDYGRRNGRRQKIIPSAPMWHAPPFVTKALSRPDWPPHMDGHHCVILRSRAGRACNGSTVRSNNGTPDKPTWSVYPRALRGRQIQVHGCNSSCSSRAWWSPRSQNAVSAKRTQVHGRLQTCYSGWSPPSRSPVALGGW